MNNFLFTIYFMVDIRAEPLRPLWKKTYILIIIILCIVALFCVSGDLLPVKIFLIKQPHKKIS